MNTIIAKAGVDDDRMYEQAAEILKRGGLVAFPTETVYGLGGDALNRMRHIGYMRQRAGHRTIRS